MADTKISGLTAASVAALANEFAINEAGVSKKLTLQQIKDLLKPGNMFPIQGPTSGASPIASTTYYFGPLGKAIAASVTAGRNKTYFRRAGVIKLAEVWTYAGGTAGSNENWSIGISINGAAATNIATVGTVGPERNFTNTGLSISVAAGDYFELVTATPAWGTPPTNILLSGYILVDTV